MGPLVVESVFGSTKQLSALCLNYVLVLSAPNALNLASGVLSGLRVFSREYAKSPGSFAKLLTGAKTLRLPSGAAILVGSLNAASAVPARAPQVEYSNRKSSKLFFKQSKISVRGAAKNAVDHRNGGKGPGGIRKYI